MRFTVMFSLFLVLVTLSCATYSANEMRYKRVSETGFWAEKASYSLIEHIAIIECSRGYRYDVMELRDKSTTIGIFNPCG